MPLPTILAACSALSYLIGAIPFSLLVAKCYGIDVRKVGSGNIGATNVLRSAGKTAGIIALLLDAAKGFVPTFFLSSLINQHASSSPEALAPILFAVFAICGHIWPVYLKFKGGKGIATSAGALIALAPGAVLIGLTVWVIVFSISRYVSLASIIAAAVIPPVGWYLYNAQGVLLPSTLTAIGGLAIARHHSNIKRLLTGKENRISFKKSTSDAKAGPDA